MASEFKTFAASFQVSFARRTLRSWAHAGGIVATRARTGTAPKNVRRVAARAIRPQNGGKRMGPCGVGSRRFGCAKALTAPDSEQQAGNVPEGLSFGRGANHCLPP